MSKSITFTLSDDAYKVLLTMSDVCGISVSGLVSGIIEEAYPSLSTVTESMATLKAQGEKIRAQSKK